MSHAFFALASAGIPSPARGVWHLGPIPIRAYGILVVSAMALVIWITYRRYQQRGGVGEVVLDTAMWAIPFGIVGARAYHVITTPRDYFGPGLDPLAALKIWEGGLAIWGGIALGAVGAVICLRRLGQRVGPLADSIAPALLFGQVLGRFGNYFNQELFGAATTVPWGLQIDDAHLPPGYASGTLFHPTFLYEGLWNLAMGFLLIWLDRRLRFRSGQVMALYLVAYGSGRFWIEMMRLDEARVFAGLRLNSWTALLAVAVGALAFVLAGRVNAPSRVLPAERDSYLARTDQLPGENPANQAQLETEATTEAAVEIESAEATSKARKIVTGNQDLE